MWLPGRGRSAGVVREAARDDVKEPQTFPGTGVSPDP